MYNLVRRQAEVEILPLAQAERMGVITYSPLGGGLLTGKYGTASRPAAGRLVDNPRYADRYGLDSDFATADRFTAFAHEIDVKTGDTRGRVDDGPPHGDRADHRCTQPSAARGLARRS